MGDAPRHIVVGRLRKPHGLKGEVSVFPLTDRPEVHFAPGGRLLVLDLDGGVRVAELVVERSRGYHREWLLKFEGRERREEVEAMRDGFLAVPETALPPLEEGEVLLADLAGFAVFLADGTPVGLVTGLYELPQGVTLEVQGPKREFLLPYRREFVVAVDTAARRLTIAPPEGLLEL